jgi:hypothetical protein
MLSSLQIEAKQNRNIALDSMNQTFLFIETLLLNFKFNFDYNFILQKRSSVNNIKYDVVN